MSHKEYERRFKYSLAGSAWLPLFLLPLRLLSLEPSFLLSPRTLKRGQAGFRCPNNAQPSPKAILATVYLEDHQNSFSLACSSVFPRTGIFFSSWHSVLILALHRFLAYRQTAAKLSSAWCKNLQKSQWGIDAHRHTLDACLQRICALQARLQALPSPHGAVLYQRVACLEPYGTPPLFFYVIMERVRAFTSNIIFSPGCWRACPAQIVS